MKIAKKSFGESYICEQPWDEDCFVQCGESGLVISEKGNYNTAFFEAFPKNPKTFLRGEGGNLQEAEKQCWEKFQKILNCDEHEYVRYHNSENAICKKCHLFTTDYFPPIHKCETCGKEFVNNNINDKYYCIEHFIEAVSSLKKEHLERPEKGLNAFFFNSGSLMKYKNNRSKLYQFMIKNNLFTKEEDYLKSKEASLHDERINNLLRNMIIEKFDLNNIKLTYTVLDEIIQMNSGADVLFNYYFFSKPCVLNEFHVLVEE